MDGLRPPAEVRVSRLCEHRFLVAYTRDCFAIFDLLSTLPFTSPLAVHSPCPATRPLVRNNAPTRNPHLDIRTTTAKTLIGGKSFRVQCDSPEIEVVHQVPSIGTFLKQVLPMQSRKLRKLRGIRPEPHKRGVGPKPDRNTALFGNHDADHYANPLCCGPWPDRPCSRRHAK